MQDLIQVDRLQVNTISPLDGGGTLGTPGAGITITTTGDGRSFETVLDFVALTVGTVAAAAKGIGVKVFTLPAGAQVISSIYHSIAFDNADGSCDADDPVAGIGSVVASGAVAVLNGTATFMDYVTEHTATNCDGVTPLVALNAPTAGLTSGIGLNTAALVKDMYLSCAETWTGTTTITATGRITIKWTLMS